MSRPILFALVAALLTLSGCHTPTTRLRDYPASQAQFDAKTRDKIKRGIIEPGFTPEMVYLALGKPTEPASSIVDATRDGTWIYRDFHRDDRDFIQAGFRRRVIFDPVRRSDVVVTEPVDPKLLPRLEPHSLHVTFRDGKVVEIQRVAQI
jgi:hypothetical protein